MKLEEAFGKTLRELRTAANFSQEAFASECGIHRTYVSSLEHGKRQPTIKILFSIAKALQIPASQIVEKVEQKLASKTEK